MFICNNQSLFSWGDNYYGQLARTEASCNYKFPCNTSIPYFVKDVDAGFGGHCLALTTINNVISWGSNYNGELGTNDNCPNICTRSTPEKVAGGETGTPNLEQVISVATGQSHSYALLNTGEIVAWGNNTFGQLGDGTTISKSSPVFVKTADGVRLQNIQMISAGANSGYALTNDGNVYAWGNNQTNQLGCGNSNTQLNPQLVVDKNNIPISGITAIDGGKNFCLLLRNSSMVMGIGAYKGTDINENGRIYKTFPYAELITGGQTPNFYLENVIAISAGYSHSLAIVQVNNTNYVVAWGDNRFNELSSTTGGQIGTGIYTTTQYYTPQYVLSYANTKLTGATAINAGCGASYIQTFNTDSKENQFWVCGANQLGQLGTKDVFDRYYATRIDASLCQPYCANISLGPDTTFCKPLHETIKTGLSPTSFTFNWYRNNILQPSNLDTIIATNPGTYKVLITDKTGECPHQTSEIEISEKERTFDMLFTSFCNDNLTFKIIGDGDYKWYNKQDGFQLGTGKVISVSRFFTEEIIPDSIYTIWVEKVDECQPLPFQTIKKCNCTILPPIGNDTTSCYNRPYFLYAQGDSVVWYSDNTLKNPIILNNTYIPNNLSDGVYTFYATQIKNSCESAAKQINLNLMYCDSWYTVSGTIDATNINVSHTKVYLYDAVSSNIVDSCFTDIDGKFTLYTHGNIAKIYALSPNSNFANTWAGNKKTFNEAYEFIVDATIKGIEINLIPKTSDIITIIASNEFKDADALNIYSMNGEKINTIEPSIENLTDLKISKGIYVICCMKNNSITKSFKWINK